MYFLRGVSLVKQFWITGHQFKDGQRFEARQGYCSGPSSLRILEACNLACENSRPSSLTARVAFLPFSLFGREAGALQPFFRLLATLEKDKGTPLKKR